jgi:hypothetical protein
MMFYIGKTDGSDLSPEESKIGRPCKRRRFYTKARAERFLNEHIGKVDPEGLRKGHYYVDPSEAK